MQRLNNGKEIIIELQGKKILNAFVWVVGVAIILFDDTGIKAMSGPLLGSMSHACGADAPEAQPGLIRSETRTARSTHARCSECGVIDSIREVEIRGEGSRSPGHHLADGHGKALVMIVDAASSYDITVHMDNGSSRVVRTGNASEGHTGDQVKIIDRAIHST